MTRKVAPLILTAAVGCVGSLAQAQNNLYGPGQFPQFRDMAGLSGNGFGVLRDGRIGIRGALSLSTPIAHVIGNNQAVVGLSGRSVDTQFRWINTTTTDQSQKADATGQLMYGVTTPYGNIAYTHLVVSAFFDSVINLQFQPKLNCEKLALSVGVHNLADRPHAAGDTFLEDQALSRSWFVVGTYELGEGNFVSLGKGDVRYKGVFGSVNAQIGNSYKGFAEYDSFNWNYGVVYGTALGKGKRPTNLFITAAMVAGKHATWAINFSF